MTAPDWQALRGRMTLDDRVANLNTGSFGPTPRPVFERATELRRQLASDPMRFLVRTAPPLLWQSRCALARFLGTRPERLVFQTNVSQAINLVASGLRLSGPGEVLLSDREYAAMRWCCDRAAQRQGLTVRTFPLPLTPRDPDDVVAAVASRLTRRTRLLFFSHAYSANGMIVPAADLCRLAREHGAVSVVDGAHAAGLTPLDLEAVGADFYAGNCHKWLLAPMGAGFLALGPNGVDLLDPMQVSWGYRRAAGDPDAPDEFGSTPRVRFLESDGSRDPAAWICVADAIAFLEGIGLPAIWERMRELSAVVRERMAAAGLAGMTPTHPAMHAAMTAYWWPAGATLRALQRALWERLIEVPATEWPEGIGVRVSANWYTAVEEIERFVAAVPELIHESTP